MSACAEARGRFAAYLDERLPREERQAVRRHLEGCDACRAEASASDPAFLFAFAGSGDAAEVSSEETARILAAVRTGIELRKAERRVEGGSKARLPRNLGLGAAASAAAAVLVAVLAGSSGAFRQTATPLPASAPPQAARSAPEAPPSAPAEVPQAGAGRVSPFAEASGPAMGQKLPADATIYDWNPGGGQPRVVWIVDRSLDI